MAPGRKSRSALAVDDLADIVAAVAADPSAALERMIAVWRTSFAPDLGRAIEAVGARTVRPLEAELPAKVKQRAARLTELVTTATTGTLSTVIAEVEPFLRSTGGAATLPVADAMLAREPDPRIAFMANRLFANPPISGTAKLERRLLTSIERHGDGGLVAILAASPPPPNQFTKPFDAARIERVKAKLEKRSAAATPLPPAVLHSLLAASELAPSAVPDAADASALLEAIYTNLDDDGVRQVYADYLMERGDPRGEIMNLQLAGGGKKREKELLAKHRAEMLGPFGACVNLGGLGWSRGFLSRATAATTWPAVAENAFLEHLVLDRHLFAIGCRFPRLVRADYAMVSQLVALFECAPRLAELHCSIGSDDELAELERIPHRPMTVFHAETSGQLPFLQRLLAVPIVRGARAIELRVYQGGGFPLRSLLQRVPDPCVRFEFGSSNLPLEYELSRDGGLWSLDLRVGELRSAWRARALDQLRVQLAGLQVRAADFTLRDREDLELTNLVGGIVRDCVLVA